MNRSPVLSVSGRQALFAAARFDRPPNRSSYDVFPNGREFVMMARGSDAPVVQPSLVVRMNWASGLTARASLQTGDR